MYLDYFVQLMERKWTPRKWDGPLALLNAFLPFFFRSNVSSMLLFNHFKIGAMMNFVV